MSEDTAIPGPLNNVIRIDDERIKGHLDRVVRGTVEETLNSLLDAEADRLCNVCVAVEQPGSDEAMQVSMVGMLSPDVSSLLGSPFHYLLNHVELGE